MRYGFVTHMVAILVVLAQMKEVETLDLTYSSAMQGDVLTTLARANTALKRLSFGVAPGQRLSVKYEGEGFCTQGNSLRELEKLAAKTPSACTTVEVLVLSTAEALTVSG